eukprot:scaffold106973_cov35-Attheya_sp.AAC.1
MSRHAPETPTRTSRYRIRCWPEVMRSRTLTLGSLVTAGLSAAMVMAQGGGFTQGGPWTFVGPRAPAPPPNSSSAACASPC